MLRVAFLLASVLLCNGFPKPQLSPKNSRDPVSHQMAASSSSSIDIQNVKLSSGVTMQVESSSSSSAAARNTKNKHPLLFLHGSFHGSWCWSERFFPYFVKKGYNVVALNWRGTGGTYAGDGVKKVKIMEHVADLEAFLEEVLPTIILPAGNNNNNNNKPIIICHSFGGLALMKYLETRPKKASEIAGIVTICSVPPSGNGKMTMRYLRRSLMDSWKITAGFAMKRALTNSVLCRQLFFGGDKKVAADGSVVEDYGVTDEEVSRYQELFTRDSEATIDLFDLAKQLPSFVTTDDGKAPFVDELPPCLVMGATDDMIVDREGLQETAEYFGLETYKLVDSPHDVMLGAKWQNAADALEEWITEEIR